MKVTCVKTSLAVLACAAVVMGDSGSRSFKAKLSGFQEVPTVSTQATGEFRARINSAGTEIAYELEYSGLEGSVLASHVHLGARGVAGGVMFFLCGGGSAPACPASGKVTGTVTATDVIGPAAQGIAPGEFAEALRALRAGMTYANVHSTKFPGGEIRGQIKDEDDD